MTSLPELRLAVAEAIAALEAHDQATKIGPTDPGTHSMRRHMTERQTDRDTERTLAAYKRQADQRAKLADRVRKARHNLHEAQIAEQRATVDLDGLAPGDYVHDGHTWWEVRRVNRTTVTLLGWHGDFRLRLDRIARVQKAGERE